MASSNPAASRPGGARDGAAVLIENGNGMLIPISDVVPTPFGPEVIPS